MQRSYFTERSLYAKQFLHIDAFTHGNLYTQKLLQRAVFTQGRSYTQMLLHTEVFTHGCFRGSLYAQMPLYKELLHRDPFTQKRLYAERLWHRRFCTETLLHREAFTHGNLDTEKKLHTHTSFYTENLTHRSLYTEQPCLNGSSGVSALQFYIHFWLRTLISRKGCSWRFKIVILQHYSRFWQDYNFTSVFAIWPSFRARWLPLTFHNCGFTPLLHVRPYVVRLRATKFGFNQRFRHPTCTISAKSCPRAKRISISPNVRAYSAEGCSENIKPPIPSDMHDLCTGLLHAVRPAKGRVSYGLTAPAALEEKVRNWEVGVFPGVQIQV